MTSAKKIEIVKLELPNEKVKKILNKEILSILEVILGMKFQKTEKKV
jgi:hypothetical protein